LAPVLKLTKVQLYIFTLLLPFISIALHPIKLLPSISIPEICWFPSVPSGEARYIVGVKDIVEIIFEVIPTPSILTPTARILEFISE